MYNTIRRGYTEDKEMIAMNMVDVKDFMGKLLIGEVFDSFLLSEASITTFNAFHIDGSLYKSFYDDAKREDLKENEQEYSSWADVKAFCFSIIKGKRTPLHFKIVFQLSRSAIREFLAENHLSMDPAEIFGLFVNFQYDGSAISCTTGTSLKTFSLDKSFDNAWDIWIMSFFKKYGIPTEKL